MVKFWMKALIAVVVLPGFLAGVAVSLHRSGFFDIERVEIVLETSERRSLHLKPLVEDLEKRLAILRGRGLWSVDLPELSREFDDLEWVASHSLSRRWPSSLKVSLRPHEVKALHLTRNGNLLPVIGDGRMLPAVEPRLAPDVVLLEGQEFHRRADLRARALSLLEEVPAEGTFSRQTISELQWSPKDGFHAKMTQTGIDVKLGDDRFAIKAVRVGQVIDYLNNRGITAQSLDANLSKKVLVRLQEDSLAIETE